MSAPLRIYLDPAPLRAFIAETSALLAHSERPPEARHAFAHRILGLLEHGGGIRLDQLSATAADELRFALEVSEDGRGLVAAFRAGN